MAARSLSDVCDPDWHHSRDRLIVSGFLFSILVLILPIILLIILIIHNQMVRIYVYSFNEISVMHECVHFVAIQILFQNTYSVL